MAHRLKQFESLALLPLESPVPGETDNGAPVLLRLIYGTPRPFQKRK